MSGWVIWAVLLLWALSMLCWGFLSVFSQGTLQRFMDWYTLADRRSEKKGSPQTQGSRSQRVAGVFATLIGLWLFWELVTRLFQRGPSVPSPANAIPPAHTGHHWSALVFGLVTIALGIFAIVKPQVLLRMTQANFPNRKLSKKMVNRSRQAGRVLGVLAIAFGAFLLLLWYGWTH